MVLTGDSAVAPGRGREGEDGAAVGLQGQHRADIAEPANARVALHVWGECACFARPEFKVERVSYEAMPPSAARGILEAIHWKPGLFWEIERIRVLAPIRFGTIVRNEVTARAALPARPGDANRSAALSIDPDTVRDRRQTMFLRNVSYAIEARLVVVDPAGTRHALAEHLAMFRKKARRGRYFHAPYLGLREFPAAFALLEPGEAEPEDALPAEQRNRVLGRLPLYGGYRAGGPQFFEAALVDGVLHVPPQAAHGGG